MYICALAVCVKLFYTRTSENFVFAFEYLELSFIVLYPCFNSLIDFSSSSSQQVHIINKSRALRIFGLFLLNMNIETLIQILT